MLLLISLLLATPIEPMEVLVTTGASITNQETTNKVRPYASVLADFPVVIGDEEKIRARVEGVYSGDVAATNVDLTNLQSIDAVKFDAGFHYTIGHTDTARTSISLSGGVSSRLSNQTIVKNPGHGELCFGIFRKDQSASFNVCPIGISGETGDQATVGRIDGQINILNDVRLRTSVIIPYGNGPSNALYYNQVHNVTTTVSVSVILFRTNKKTVPEGIPLPTPTRTAISI